MGSGLPGRQGTSGKIERRRLKAISGVGGRETSSSMQSRLVAVIRQIFFLKPKRIPSPFDRRHILILLDAGIAPRTLIRQYGFTPDEIAKATSAKDG